MCFVRRIEDFFSFILLFNRQLDATVLALSFKLVLCINNALAENPKWSFLSLVCLLACGS